MAWRGLTWASEWNPFSAARGAWKGKWELLAYILNEEGFHYLRFSLASIASAEPPDCDCIIDGPLFHYSENFQVLLVLKLRM